MLNAMATTPLSWVILYPMGGVTDVVYGWEVSSDLTTKDSGLAM